MQLDAQAIRNKIHLFNANADKKHIVAGRLSKGLQSYLLACMPKSGSTWIRKIFDSLPACRHDSMVPCYGSREQEIDASSIDLMMQSQCGFNTISQHHVKYNLNTKNCLTQFCIQPIVLTRDIRDNLVSLVDHWRRAGDIPSFSTYVERDYFSDDFSSSVTPDVSPLEYATILHTPWIINFYLSWKKCTQQNEQGKLSDCISPVFITYEEMVSDPVSCIFNTFSRVGLIFDLDEVAYACNKANELNTQKNVASIGRGIKAFEKDKGAADNLENILRLYRHEDLSGIGIN